MILLADKDAYRLKLPLVKAPATALLLLVYLGTLAALSLHGRAQTPAAQAEFRQGVEALRSDRLEDAIAIFRRVTRAAPRFAEAQLNFGLALSQQGDNEDAVTALEQAVKIKPALRGAHLFLAISQYRMGRFAAAAASIRKETVLSSGDAKAWMWQGIIDLALADLPDAVDALNRAAKLDPHDPDILYHRGRASLDLSRESYEQMFHLDPNSWHVHQVLAQADVEADKDGDAAEQYRLAIASAPTQSGLHEALGTSLWRLGLFDEAEAEFNTALRIDPGDMLAMYKLGCLEVDRSRPAEARPLLQKVLVKDTSLQLTAYYLGRAEMQLGNEADAIAHFKQIIAADVGAETIRQAYFQLSRAYRRLQRTEEANAAQAKYRELDEASRQEQQKKLEKTQHRFDRDTRVPAPPAEPQDSTP